MKFPTIKEMAKEVAEKALDEFEYKGKTLRQWIEIISASEHGTNLAEVGTDCISRQDALEAFGLSEKTRKYGGDHSGYDTMMMYEIQDTIEDLPPIQPEIVMCKDCKYAEYIDDVQTLWCTECGQGRTVAPNDFCSYTERREVTT